MPKLTTPITPAYLRELATSARHVGHNRDFLARALDEAATEIENLIHDVRMYMDIANDRENEQK